MFAHTMVAMKAKKVGAAKSKVAFTSSSTKQMKKKKKPVSGAGSSGAAKSGSKKAAGKPLSVCILEIGAGGRITTVRNETENFVSSDINRYRGPDSQ